MRIAIGADHAGFALKERLRAKLAAKGHEVADFGTHSADSVDYPDFAAAVAQDVAEGKYDRGILVCWTGIGMSIAANKVQGARAAYGANADEVRLTRQHNDANILTLGSKYMEEHLAEELVEIFLHTDFLGGRHTRRLDKIRDLEKGGNS